MNNKKFLDYEGLQYFYELLESTFIKSEDLTGTESDPIFTSQKSNIVSTVVLNPSSSQTYNDGYKHITLTETDPTVPSWAKANTKPSYTLDEITDGTNNKWDDFVKSIKIGTASALTPTDGVVTLPAYPTNYITSISSSTDNQIVRWDGTTGKKVQGTSGATIDDTGNITATSFVKSGGTASQFLKANGTVDSSTYLTQSVFDSGNPDLAAIEALTGTSGLLKKTATDTWSLDTTAYAPKASPTFTGTPKAPTAAASTDNTQIATTEFVHDVADSSISDNIKFTSNGSGYILQLLNNRWYFPASVDTTTTPGDANTILSKSDISSTYAPINSPTFTGTPLITTTPSAGDNSHKIADTAFVSTYSNYSSNILKVGSNKWIFPAGSTSGTVTGDAYTIMSKSQVASAIDAAVGQITQITYSVVQDLPQTGAVGTIYLKASSNSSTGDAYDEYIWLTSTSSFELIGHKILDLSNYWNSTNLVAITEQEILAVVTPAA